MSVIILKDAGSKVEYVKAMKVRSSEDADKDTEEGKQQTQALEIAMSGRLIASSEGGETVWCHNMRLE